MNGRLAVTLENPKILRLSEGGHDDARSEGGHDDASEGIDRISNLPESILHHIFSLVDDTLDVITASAVSRKWRYIWLSMPSLTFSTFHKIWSDKRKTLSSHKVNEEFKDFVNWVLMSQNSSITVQSFCLCGYIHESDDYTLYRWMSVLADRKLQELGLMLCLEYLYLTLAHPECFKTLFCNLKSLKLILIPNDQSMNLMVGLLNCFPNLEALTICFAWYETVEFSVEDIPSPSVTYHLKMVELLEVRGGKNELEFMRFLLKHGRALDRMSISWAADIKDPKDITSEIMKFPRTSSTVVLKFLQLESEVDVSRL